MLSFDISPQVKERCPDLRLGCLRAQVRVSQTHEALWREINAFTSKAAEEMQVGEISSLPVIQEARAAYKALGKDPSRYRLSADALLRRVVSGKGLYQINTVVDIINFISIQTGFSIGGYAVKHIEGKSLLRKGRSTDEYQAIGRGTLNIENLPVLQDEIGAFGSPTSDSLRTMVTEDTEDFLLVFFDFGKNKTLTNALVRAKSLLESYADGKGFELWEVD